MGSVRRDARPDDRSVFPAAPAAVKPPAVRVGVVGACPLFLHEQTGWAARPSFGTEAGSQTELLAERTGPAARQLHLGPVL
jgi:hypothetical protein